MLSELIAIIMAMVFLGLSYGGADNKVPMWIADLPSLVVLLVLVVPVFIRKGIWKEFMIAVKLLKKEFHCSLNEMKKAQYAVELMQKQLFYAGALIVLFSLINILLNTVEMSQVGPCIAVALISLLYMVLLELLLLPLEIGVKKRILDYMEEE